MRSGYNSGADLRQVHAVGLYGPNGGGVAEHLDYEAQLAAGDSSVPIPGSVMDRVDIITGECKAFKYTECPPIISLALQLLSERPMALLAVTSQDLTTSSTWFGLTPLASSSQHLFLPLPSQVLRHQSHTNAGTKVTGN